MTVNLHTHTYRCGHATGTEREYIERAVANGITHMGFSDHAPFRDEQGREANFRVPAAQVREYMETIRALREEYRDRIKLYAGFEMEYYPRCFEQMLRGVNDVGADYLILGLHFTDYEFAEGVLPTISPTQSEEVLERYASLVSEGIASGVYTYVAHPDIINFQGDDGTYRAHIRKICRASVAYGVPLEINMLGIRDGRCYPRGLFWQIAGEEGCEVVFGFDAHDPMSAYDGASILIVEEMVRRFGLRYVSHPRLVDPKTGRKYEL